MPLRLLGEGEGGSDDDSFIIMAESSGVRGVGVAGHMLSVCGEDAAADELAALAAAAAGVVGVAAPPAALLLAFLFSCASKSSMSSICTVELYSGSCSSSLARRRFHPA